MSGLSHETLLLIDALIAVVGLILLITRLRVHPFIALILAAGFLGLSSGMPVAQIMKAFQDGFGGVLGKAGSLLSGAFIVEVIMSWPGLGSLTVSSLLSRDLYVLVACLVFSALLLALGNLLADILLALTDPRIRHPRQF